MSIKKFKTLSTLLLVVAIIAGIYGYGASSIAEKAAARDVNDIGLKIVERKCYYNADESPYINGRYHIELTYEIKNGTKATLGWVQIKTHVYDKSGVQIGTLNTEFGGYYGSSMSLKAGDTIKLVTDFAEHQPGNNQFFVDFYETPVKDLRFEYEVTEANFDN